MGHPRFIDVDKTSNSALLFFSPYGLDSGVSSFMFTCQVMFPLRGIVREFESNLNKYRKIGRSLNASFYCICFILIALHVTANICVCIYLIPYLCYFSCKKTFNMF